jgi:hypothetical protein
MSTPLSYLPSTSINNFMLPVSTTLPLHWSTFMYDPEELGFYLVTLLVGCAYLAAHVAIMISSTS